MGLGLGTSGSQFLGLHGGSALKGWMLWDTALCC